MSRTLSGIVETSLNDEVLNPFFAVELDFDDGTFTAADGTVNERILRLWTGYGELVYEGDTYYGTGNLLNISSVEETAEIAAKGITLTLSGVPSEVISLALTEPYQGRLCKVYFGVFTVGELLDQSSTTTSKNYILQQDGGLIQLEEALTSLTEVFVGYMDQMNINEGPESSTIELHAENKLIDLERARVGRFTSEYQKSIYPTDKGFDFVESLQEQKLVWGRAGV
jgi:hypothetical protein